MFKRPLPMWWERFRKLSGFVALPSRALASATLRRSLNRATLNDPTALCGSGSPQSALRWMEPPLV